MIAIRIQQLSKHFDMPINLEGLTPVDAWYALLRILGFNIKNKSKKNIQIIQVNGGEVLQNISLDIEKGSAVCLVGPSGSGKSVLLSILAGVIPPSSGRVEINGLASSLLKVGDNLDVRLTAYENILKHQEMMQIPRDYTKNYIQEVIEFAELENFIHVPVRTYSTGMIMRLSIALALHGNPEIIFVDDILGVGDIAFQQKCIARLHSLRSAGCTLVISFSDELIMKQIATHVITLDNGQMYHQTFNQWLAQQHTNTIADINWRITTLLPENDLVAFHSISVEKKAKNNHDFLYFSVKFITKVELLQCRPLIDIMLNKIVLFRNLHPQYTSITTSGSFICTTEVPLYLLNDGTYKIMICILSKFNNMVYSLKAFDAITLILQRDLKMTEQAVNIVAIPFSWEIERISKEIT